MIQCEEELLCLARSLASCVIRLFELHPQAETSMHYSIRLMLHILQICTPSHCQISEGEACKDEAWVTEMLAVHEQDFIM
jgi:hypothetical protein